MNHKIQKTVLVDTIALNAKLIRQHLNDAELTQFFLAVWNEVIGPICGGKNDHVLDDFVMNHMLENYPATEWRFQGHLGFGGKFYTRHDLHCSVGCYPEDETPERRKIITRANEQLEALRTRYVKANSSAKED